MAILDELERTSEERFLGIYQDLSEQGFGPLDHEVAKALKFRPQAIRKLPMEKRARTARRIIEGKGNAELCYELFGTYLVRKRTELVVGFLDGTGVPHQEGMIEDTEANPPAPDKIADTVSKLDGEFEAADVTLYLALCVEMWPGSEELKSAWQGRSGD